MGAFWDAAAHNLIDLGIAIPLAPQISLSCQPALMQYHFPAHFYHMSNGYSTELPFDL
jgi:hypothetical protein